MFGLGQLGKLGSVGRALAEWTPAQLWPLGATSPGMWSDPPTTASLFSTSAGTTAISAIGTVLDTSNPAGLVLDRKGDLVLGPELVVNGTFPVDIADWTVASGAAAVRDTTIFASGGIRVQGGGSELTAGVKQVLSGLVVGRSYKAVASAYAPSANARVNAAVISLDSAPLVGGSNSQVSAEDVIQEITFTFVAAGTSATIYLFVLNRGVGWGTSSDYAYFDNISVKEIPGIHLSQATATSRPVASARKNELLATAVLSTQNVTVTAVQRVLSFTGTGTVTLSGVSTAGPLVGTGAADRVSLTFTPTAGTLTLTVSGSVTLAQLETAA